MKRSLTMLISLPVLAGCTVFGIRTVEEPEYRVVQTDGAIEVREYPPVIVARTQVRGDYDESSTVGFNRLAGYIFGGNQSGQDIAMTAPVVQETNGVSIEMTAPVLQEQSGDVWTMAFVMPSEYTLETLPRPLDPEVELAPVDARKTAVISYSGSLKENRIEEQSALLKAWVEASNYIPLSGPRSAAYDPPWTLPFLRRNEIHVDVR